MIVRNSSKLPYVIEGLGSFIFVYVVLATIYSKNVLLVGIFYLVLLLFSFSISQQYSSKQYPILFFNPIITIIFSSSGILSIQEFTPFILSQIIGGILGYEFYKYFTLFYR